MAFRVELLCAHAGKSACGQESDANERQSRTLMVRAVFATYM